MNALLLLWAASFAAGPPSGPIEKLSAEEATKRESRYFLQARPLTSEGTCGEGYFSPDGKQVVFQAIRGSHPFYQIYIKNLADGAERMVSTGSGRTTCAYFHPTRPRLLYASSHLDPQRDAVAKTEIQRLEDLRKNPPKSRSYQWNFDPYMDIFEADLDGKNLVRLTDAPGYDAEGSYSPDGKQIVFCSFRSGNGDIYVMDADGKNVRQITDAPGYDGGPFFSPDGKRIIFRGEARKKDLLQIYVVNADGTGERQLTNNTAVNWGPYWHPDGRHVIFSTSLQGHYNYELYLLDVDSGKLERVTYTFGADVLPVFSPDGKKLLWTSKRSTGSPGEPTSQLWIADWIYSFPEGSAKAVK
jgi:Tol biopolymer transport system component